MIIGVAEQLTIGYLSSAFHDLIVLSVLIVHAVPAYGAPRQPGHTEGVR
jgi:hypothetical protein